MPEPSSFAPDNISRRIHAIRYWGILAVVLGHAMQMPYFFFNGEYFISSDSALLHEKLFVFSFLAVIYGLTLGAVPMFFLFSGFLQFMKPRDYGETVRSRMRSLVMPFLGWTAISIALLFSLKYLAGIAFYPQLLSSTDWLTWTEAIFGNYSRAWEQGTHCPYVMYQFWFIRDLFVLTLLSHGIGFLLREKRRGIFCLVLFGAILAMKYRPVILGGDALFYFSLGAFFALHRIDFLEWFDRLWHWGFSLALACFTVVWMYFQYDGRPEYIVPIWVQLSSTLLLLKFSKVIAASPKLFHVSCYLEGQSFFLYCAHAPIVLLLCGYMAYRAFWGANTSIPVQVCAVLGTGIVTAVFCTGIGMLLKRFWPRAFSIMTGGRSTAARQ